jgi:hypothetical protein
MPRTSKLAQGFKKVPATAAGQALGYSLQFTRLTAMLLEAPAGSACSLEVLDDVAEQAADGQTTLGQSKSALTTNPVADRAVSLWKTLSNWLQLVSCGLIDPDRTTFELYVSRPVEGHLIDAFHKANSPAEAQAAIAAARLELWGEAPKYANRGELPDAVKPYVNAVLEAKEDILIPILIHMRLKCGSGSPQADIETLIRRGPVSEARVFDIANQMCGWVKREVDKLLEKGLPAVIARDTFHQEYVSYVRRVDRDIILKSFAKKPSDAEKHERLCDTFVQQLDLIGLSFDDKMEAVSDFLRACTDRAKWSEVGDVHEASFCELDDDLVRTWRNHRRATAIEVAAQASVERGQLLHSRCMNHQARVQGMEPPPHFVPGCFHGLANDMVIGWHPAFRDMLGQPTAEAR